VSQLEVNPFDQSADHQKRSFEKLLQNPVLVNQIVDWYARNYEQLLETDTAITDFSRTPLAANDFFPGKISPYKLRYFYKQNPELALKTILILNSNPSLCLDVDNLPSIPLIPKAPNYMKKLIEECLVPSKQAGDVKQSVVSLDLERQKQTALATQKLRNILGFREDESTLKELSEIARLMRQIHDPLKEALYFRFVLDQAVKAIEQFAPSLNPYVTQVLEKLILLKSSMSDTDESIDLSTEKMGAFFAISVQKDLYTDDFDQNHSFRILSMGHELLHAAVFVILEITRNAQMMTNTDDKNELHHHQPKKENLVTWANLEAVIFEGISLAFEYELVRAVQKQTHDTTLLTRFTKHANNRIANIRNSNLYLSPQYRQNMLTSGLQLPKIEDTGQLNYSEGAKLAIALRRNSWQLDDLPTLLKLFRTILIEEVGSDINSSDFHQIPVDLDKNSDYQRIVSKIRRLKK